MSVYRVSKSKILSGLQCHKRLWLEVHRPELLHWDPMTEMAFRVGHQVGAVAQRLYPDGILIEPPDGDLATAIMLTKEWLRERRPLFEATFSAGGALVRVDILEPARDGRWNLVEVKSATRPKPVYYQDCAIQAWVLQQSGIELARVQLAHIDNSFVYPSGGDYRGLLRRVDFTREIQPLLADVPAVIDPLSRMLAGEQPQIAMGAQCKQPYACPFIEHCSPPATAYPVSTLIGGGRLSADLLDEGYEDLRDVPLTRFSRPLHLRQIEAINSGSAVLDPAAAPKMTAFAWPRYFLDYETTAPAVPIWPGTRPYQPIPFQFSVHVETAPGVVEQLEALPVDGGDPRREIAERLIAAVGEEGPIFMYTNYEVGCTRNLAEACPDLAPALEAIIDRLVDLYPLTKSYYYHPAMHGSFSIKMVAPTIAPDLDYAALEDIAQGAQAAEAYLEILHPDTSRERRDRLIAALREYCALDTWAMVRLAWRLEGRAS
jgi:hypothetical protein